MGQSPPPDPSRKGGELRAVFFIKFCNRQVKIPLSGGLPSITGGVGGGSVEACLHHHIIFCASAFGHFIVGDVRDLAELLGQLALSLVHGCFQFLSLLFHVGNGSLGLVSLVAQALFHETTDLGSLLLALSQQVVQLLLCLAAALVCGLHGSNGLRSTTEMFLFKTANNSLGLFVDEFEC